MLHYDHQHVSSSMLLILRRANYINMQVESGLSPLSTCILYGCLQRVRIPDAVIIQFCPPEDVEDRSVTYILLKNKGIVH